MNAPANRNPRAHEHPDPEARLLRRERDRLREDLRSTRERFRRFAEASGRFASSMRGRMSERRRLELQYAVLETLEISQDPGDSAMQVVRVMAKELGARLGVLWEARRGELRCCGTWRPEDAPPDGLEGAYEATVFPSETAEGLPPRVRREGVPIWVLDLGQTDDPRVGTALGETGGVLALPIANSGGLLYVLEFFGLEPEEPDEGAMRTFSILGNQVAQVIERKRAEVKVQALHERNRDLLESITDAFFSVDGEWRLTYINQRGEGLLGDRRRQDVLGHDLWETFPGLLDSPFEETYRRVAREGRPETVTAYYPDHDSWYDAHVYPATDGIVMYVRDVTERRLAEQVLQANAERARFLGKLADETREAADAEVVLDLSTRLLGEHLGASRVIYAEVEPDDEHFLITSVHENGVPNMAGRYSFSHFSPALVAQVRAGNSVLVADTEDGPYAEDERASYARASVRAHLDAPLVRGGRLVALLGVHQAEPREWTADELSLVEEVAERTRAMLERARAEEALRESEARRHLALDAAEMGTFVWYPQEDRGEPDERMLRLFGLGEGDTLNLAEALDSMIHPDDRELYADAVARAVAPNGDGRLDAEIRIVRRDGSLRWIAITAQTSFGGEPPQAARMYGAAVDITKRKHAEEALRESEEWLHLAERAARSGTWEWDLRSGEVRWSDEHRALFGFGEGRVTRERWWEAVHPDDVQRIQEAGRLCAEEGAQWPEIEYRITRADDGGRRWIEARGRTVLRGGRPIRILGISVDVTERRRVQRERERLRALEVVAAVQAAERQAISRELHDRVAHDIAVVHQNLQLFGAFWDTDPERALAKLESAESVVKAALEATRGLSSELRHNDAEDGLANALEEFASAAAETYPVNGAARRVNTSVNILGDESLLPEHMRGQIFLILREAVRNALKHSGCSEVTVELEVSPSGFTGRATDDGTGFEPHGGEGSPGVGLRSMRERIELLGGTFNLETSPGRGTRVEITLNLEGRRKP